MFSTFLATLLVTSLNFQINVAENSTMAKILPKTMKAVGFYKYLPISDINSLIDLEVSLPEMRKSDVLIEVKAISVNPIDTKIRAPKSIVEENPRILGWDGAGIVVDRGENVTLHDIGEEVFFFGDLSRNGSNAQYVAIDENVVGPKPKNFNFVQAASMPLTSMTAYESLFDRLMLSDKDKGKSLLVINSAGGVGSIATQLAQNLGLQVIGTASRPETQNFTKLHGASVVLNHSSDLIPQLEANGYGSGVDYILVNYDPFPYWDTLMKSIKPQGKICLIADSSGLVDLRPLKEKSITLVSEMLGTRNRYNTEDKYLQHEMLKKISKMFDDGQLKCTLTKTLSPFNADNLKKAHQLIESKRMIGNLVLTGFD